MGTEIIGNMWDVSPKISMSSFSHAKHNLKSFPPIVTHCKTTRVVVRKLAIFENYGDNEHKRSTMVSVDPRFVFMSTHKH